MFHLGIFLFCLLSLYKVSLQQESCQIGTNEREDCGFGFTSEYECQSRGCCYEPCHGCGKVPWCFKSMVMYADECSLANEFKKDCGYYGIKSDECKKRGCCYEPTSTDNIPWCFSKKIQTTTTTTTQIPTTTTEFGYEGDVKPVGGDVWDTENGARIEVYHDGRWGTVCDDNFDQNAILVTCRQFGYTHGNLVFPPSNVSPDKPIWMDGFVCTGNEIFLTDCDIPEWGYSDCSHDEDVYITCYYEDESYEGSASGNEGSATDYDKYPNYYYD